MSTQSHSVRVRHESGYRFSVDFGDAFPKLLADEPEPIGTGAGPSPEQVLVASVANCLCASLHFALSKYRQTVEGISAEATATVSRNARGRLRVHGIAVAISLDADAAALGGADRALAQFEDFCTVTESVRVGVPVSVSVEDRHGTVLASGQGARASAANELATPEDLVRAFVARANAGDIEGLVALYEPDAVVAVGPPRAAGRDEIRTFLTNLLSRKTEFDPVEPGPATVSGDLALTVTPTGTGRASLEVSRRQADGSWRFVIDQLKLDLGSAD